jgi:hypothetical protein
VFKKRLRGDEDLRPFLRLCKGGGVKFGRGAGSYGGFSAEIVVKELAGGVDFLCLRLLLVEMDLTGQKLETLLVRLFSSTTWGISKKKD